MGGGACAPEPATTPCRLCHPVPSPLPPPPEQVQLSKLLLRSSRASDAIAHLWPAVQDAPKEASAPLRYQLALALALDKQPASAEPLLRQVLGLSSARSRLHWLPMICADRPSAPRQVLELEPAYTDASLALASILHAQGKTQAALDLLDEIATSQPELASWCEQQARAFKGGG